MTEQADLPLAGRFSADNAAPSVEVSDPFPWDMLPRETTRAYAGFCTYRELGPARTIEGAFSVYAKRFGLKEGAAVHRGFWLWSRDNAWRARTQAYDADQDRQGRVASEYVRTLARAEILDGLVPIIQRFKSVLLGEPVLDSEGNKILVGHVSWDLDDDGHEIPVIQLGRVTSAQVALFREWCAMAGLAAPKVVEVSGRGGGPIDMSLRPRREQLEEAKNLPTDQKAQRYKQLIGDPDS